MSEQDRDGLIRENTYLKLRVAQLERDVEDLGAQANRLAQQLDRAVTRRVPADTGRPIR